MNLLVFRGLSGFKLWIRGFCELVLVVPDALYAGTVEISKNSNRKPRSSSFSNFYCRLYISRSMVFGREHGLLFVRAAPW